MHVKLFKQLEVLGKHRFGANSKTRLKINDEMEEILAYIP